MGLLKNIVDDNKFSPEDLPKFENKLFFEGKNRRVDIEKFAVLLFLSTVIATYGVLGDSTATVVGAMIIAPLMTPILATSAALVMGNMERAGQACLLVIASIAGAICLAWISGIIHPGVVSFTTNTQIIARVSPNLIDFIVALASGTVGAFAVSRDDIADSLAGVAISIALVPPLAVVGISLSHGQWADASGAFLLFFTNFFSILLAGGGTLALLGLSAASTNELKKSARREAFVSILIGALLMAIPLAITSFKVAQKSHLEHQAQQIAQKWFEKTSFDIIKLEAKKNHVEIVITGSGEIPSLQGIGTELQAKIDGEIGVRLKVLSSRIELYPESTSDNL